MNRSGIPSPKKELVRSLGLFDTSMLLIGTVIGSGIFLTAGIVAGFIPSASLMLLAWLVGGLLMMAGALTFAELGSAMPEAGGVYVYIREAYGPLAGFLFGWIFLFAYQTGTVAALAIGFADFLAYFLPSLSSRAVIQLIPGSTAGHLGTLSVSGEQCVALVGIIALTAVNYAGVRFGTWIQNLLGCVKIAAILSMALFGLLLGRGHTVDFSVDPYGLSWSRLIVGFGAAQVAIGWAFGGWDNVTYVAGEIKDPQRNLPLAFACGTVALTALYLIVNYVYLYAIPLNELRGTVRVAQTATAEMFGGAGAGLISAAAMVSVFGALNGVILSGPRVVYAMARDELFFHNAAVIHPRFGTPTAALSIQAIWACILTLSGSFGRLLTFATFVAIMFWIAGALAVVILRAKRPDLPRPYRTVGYPYVPLVFALFMLGVLIDTLVQQPVESLAGMAITACGIPAYYWWKRARRGGHACHQR